MEAEFWGCYIQSEYNEASLGLRIGWNSERGEQQDKRAAERGQRFDTLEKMVKF